MPRHAALLSQLTLYFGLVLAPAAAGQEKPRPEPAAAAIEKGWPVYVAGEMSEVDRIAVSAAVAAGGKGRVLLFDSAASSKANQNFLASMQAASVVPIGAFPNGVPDLQRRLGVTAAPAVQWQRGPPVAAWQALLPRAAPVVVCPAEPRRLLLHAACLAGALEGPLFVRQGDADDAALKRFLDNWRPRQVYVIGDAKGVARADVRLADEAAVVAAYLGRLQQQGPVRTLVVANPHDRKAGLGDLSALAPWVALQHRAALVLTNAKGDDVAAAADAVLKQPGMAQADHVLILADHKAVPLEVRPNPAPGKDTHIEMEPLTPRDAAPFSFAVGRLFNHDPSVVALVLARRHLLREDGRPRKALMASNPGGGLPLLEVFSRNTSFELRNHGYDTRALFEHDVNKQLVRKLLPEQDVFLWEGHYRTLIDHYEFLTWNEPLRPALLFLQSCLALNEKEAQPLLQRGAVAIVGSSTRIYSATGGAFTLAYFDALLYDEQTLGGALRQAKNFLVAYAQLKEKRLGANAKLAGANVRSAWAFSLWGDPTLRLPVPARPRDALPPVRCKAEGDHIVLRLPDASYPKVTLEGYESLMKPNARLAGLLTAADEDARRRFVPFVFAEVALPQAPAGRVPRLQGRVPERNWVFLWDARRRCGYLLVTPRGRSQTELSFRVRWE